MPLLVNYFKHFFFNEDPRFLYKEKGTKLIIFFILFSFLFLLLFLFSLFSDDHILKPVFRKPCHYVSTDEKNSRMYRFENTMIHVAQLHKEPVQTDAYKIKIINIERGYNKEFQLYNIVIVDKPLDPRYCTNRSLPGARMKLNRTISCYKE